MKLYYDNILLGEVLTNHRMTIDEALEFVSVNMDEFAEKNKWDNWNYEKLRMEI